MDRTLTTLLFLSALLLPAEWARSSGPELVATHTVIAYRSGAITSGFDVELQVTNPGDASLADLTLSLVALPPFFKGWSTLELGSLAPQQSREIFLHLEASPDHGRHEVAGRVLHFIGKYHGADGTLQVLSVVSHPGGVQ
jgi:hypothetical protein